MSKATGLTSITGATSGTGDTAVTGRGATPGARPKSLSVDVAAMISAIASSIAEWYWDCDRMRMSVCVGVFLGRG